VLLLCFRLDFDELILTQPNSTSGICENDVFVTSGSVGRGPPAICGTNTGQHMYIDVSGSSSPARLTVVRNGVFASRSFRIKITQIECYSPDRAPPGCLQYFTGISGTILSYNFFFPTDTDNVRQLANQNYRICIRREDGFCSTCFTQCPDPEHS
jgi:hypothetical protein